jgi:EAL domain-containing protein (putative c-di-GMP-specific phosphodiesterase class I)
MAGDALLFVNVLPRSLEDPEWRGDPVDALLDGSALRRERVILEVSERALGGDAVRACEALDRLRDRGFRFAIDDVGTGYASLETLQALHPDFVKVDRSLVRAIDAQRIKQEAMSSLLSIAGSLGADVIAEGVETEGEAVALQRLGVRLAQGYLFAPPLARAGEASS